MSKTFHRCNLFLALILFFTLSCAGLFAAEQPGAADPLIKKAKDHLNLFQYDQALTLLNQATQLEPENWEPWFLIGRSHMKQKKEAQAENFLQKAIKLNPEELEVQKALGALYIFFAKESQNAGKPEEMTDFLHKACKAYPGGTKIWLTLMDNWWKSGSYDKIKQEGDYLLRANAATLEQGDDKNLQGALVIIAKTFYREQDLINTEKYLKNASMIRQHNDDLYALRREIKSKSEESIRKLVDSANESFNKGDYDKALELLQTANKTPGPKSAEILELMERIEREAGLMKSLKEIDSFIAASQFEPALEKLEEVSIGHPEDDRIASKLELVRGKVDKIKAEEAKQKAALIATRKQKLDRKQQLDFFIKEGSEHEKNRNFDMALISFEKALELFPTVETTRKKIEELKVKAKEAKELRDAFAVSLADLENLFNAGKFAESYEKAQKMLADYVDKSSCQRIAFVHAETCLNLEKYDESRKMLIEFEEDKEQQALYNYIKGMIAYREGNRDDALELLKKVEALKSGFRSDVSSTIWWIYLYKFQMGIYIVLIILLFPAIRMARASIATWKINNMLSRIERIKESGNYEANLAFLEERYAKDDTPNPKQIAVMLAEALLRSNNVQRAYEISAALLKKDNRNANARRIAGEACLQLQDTSPMGLEYIQGLLKIDGSRKPVIKFLAQTYMQNKADHKMAQDFILESISMNPGDLEAIVYLADTYIKRATYNQQTLKIFEKAIKAAPEVPDYYQGIIENYRRLENPQEAEKWLETAREKFPAENAFSATAAKSSAMRGGAIPRTSSGLPDYESIGSEPSQPNSHAGGAFPDYESIGNEPDAQDNSSSGGFPDYESIGKATPVPVPASSPGSITGKPAANPVQIQGPTKNCPHCSALNAAKEYYCTSCGKGFG